MKTKKRLYVKPRIDRVGLKPEEAVLTTCKTSSGGGPGSIVFGDPCTPSYCHTIGS